MAVWPSTIDDDGTGESGTGIDDAFFDLIKAYIDEASAAPVPSVLTVINGGSNVFDVTLPTPRPFYYVRVYPAGADITIRSIIGAPRAGDRVLIENVADGNVVWCSSMQGAVSARLSNRVTSGATPIGVRGSALYVFDSAGYWMLAQHDHGKASRVPYNAANFTTTGAGSWLVEAADVDEHVYRLAGDEVTATVNLRDVTITGTPSQLVIGGWPFTFPANAPLRPVQIYTTGVIACYLSSTPGTSILQLNRQDGSTFPAGLAYVSFAVTVQAT